MSERLFGVETEYGLSVIPVAGVTRESDRVMHDIIELARRFPHLPGRRSSGIFLGNGGRFYIDCGAHPEMATPECANPWDVCRYVQAGEHMLRSIVEDFTRRDRRTAQTLVSKGNVDYGTRATWGCHESYMHHGVDQETLSKHIIPHLVSRIIFCGAGGFDSHSPGIDFVLSPRVPHLQAVVSGESTSSRGIFHTRDEPLCGKGYRRLHVLCGESLCGDTGTWLKMGTTALVVALIEAGKRPGDEMALQDPLAAIRTFAGDPSCTHTAKLIHGREATALAIQYHYLALAERHANAAFMPPWAGEVCRRWRAILDRLQRGHGAVARTLDWAIKLAVFENHVRRYNTTLAQLAHWTPVLQELSLALGGSRLTTALVQSKNTTVTSIRKRLTLHLNQHGLQWEELGDVLTLRMALFEIDTRFSLVGERGLFTALDRKRVLDHHVPGVDNIPHAIEYPPAVGRAALRGQCIRRLSGQNGRYACEWDAVFDMKAKQKFDLSDPFCLSEQWVMEPEANKSGGRDEMFRLGYYADVRARFACVPGPRLNINDLECEALSHARLGCHSEALAVIESARHGLSERHYIGLKLSVFSNGLVPAMEEMKALITIGDRLSEGSAECDSYPHFIYFLYKALYQTHAGLVSECEAIFVRLLASRTNRSSPRMYSRAQCYFGELLRRLGRNEEAVQMVKSAYQTHRLQNLPGDLATQSLPMLAKLSSDAEAGPYLDEAESILRLQRNDLGLARVLCLRARKLRTEQDRNEIARLRTSTPALASCKVARRITRHWDDWMNSGTEPGSVDDYWGV